MNVLSLVKYLIYSVIRDENVSVSINVRLIERKDRGYFWNYKMFNKKNDFPLSLITLMH